MVMKVCHMTSAHNRYDVRIFEKECKSLANYGYDVTLIVNDCNDDEIIDNVKIISTKFKPKNRMDRIMNSKNIILKKAIDVDADIYHFHDPELLQVGNKLKKFNKKVIFDSHEDVSAQIIDKHWIPKFMRSTISSLYEKFEVYSVKNYDAVISVTPHIVEKFKIINDNSIMVTNYPIIKSDDILKNPMNAICFAGGISKQWNHDKIIGALDYVENIRYILAGSGTNDYMNYLMTLPSWNKVDFRGKVTHSEVKKIYSQSMVGMALNYSNQVKLEGTLGNTKLFEYMEAGIPVICSNYNLWKKIIDEYNCGICVDPCSVGEITDAIKYLITNPELAKKMGHEGRRAVMERFNWDVEKQKLLDLYKHLIN